MPSQQASDAEISLARKLAHVDKEVRDSGFDLVETWLSKLQASSKDAERLEVQKMWKALFYCVWMSDKTPVQQELIRRVAGIVDHLSANSQLRARGVVYLSCFAETLQREWGGLDRYRLDKYMSLVRRMLDAAFRYIQTCKFQGELAEEVVDILARLCAERPNGIRLHIADIWADELLATLPGLTAEQFLYVCRPVLSMLKHCDEKPVFQRVLTEVWDKGLLPALRNAAGDKDEEMGQGKAKPLGKVDVAAVARAIFAIAGHPDTRADQRDGVYGLHKKLAAVATAKQPGADVYGDVQALRAVASAKALQDAQAAASKKRKAQDTRPTGKKARLLEGEDEDEDEGDEGGEDDDDEDDEDDMDDEDEDEEEEEDLEEEDEDESASELEYVDVAALVKAQQKHKGQQATAGASGKQAKGRAVGAGSKGQDKAGGPSKAGGKSRAGKPAGGAKAPVRGKQADKGQKAATGSTGAPTGKKARLGH